MYAVQSQPVREAQIGTEPFSEEASLIRAAQRGHAEAFEQLVSRYDRQVLQTALNLLRNQEDAREVFQEAFLKAYRSLHRFRFECSFSTWIYRITVNLCVDRLRRRKARREQAAVEETDEGAVDRLRDVPDAGPDGDPLRLAIGREIRERIEQAMEKMSPRERAVFALRHFEGMRLKEIGEVLGTSEEAAKNCLFRVHQKLRAALGGFL